MSKEQARGASQAYINATKMIIEKSGIAPRKGLKPRASYEQSLEDLIEDGDDSARQLALKWYKKGIKRGLQKATDLMAEEKITFDGEHVLAPTTITIKVSLKMNGGDRESQKITVKATDIGFK